MLTILINIKPTTQQPITIQMKPLLLLFAVTAIFTSESKAEKPVHLFVLSGQSNMQGMDPETGFMPEAKKLFKDEKVVYIKVAKGGQPICCLLYTSPSPRDLSTSRMPSSA